MQKIDNSRACFYNSTIGQDIIIDNYFNILQRWHGEVEIKERKMKRIFLDELMVGRKEKKLLLSTLGTDGCRRKVSFTHAWQKEKETKASAVGKERYKEKGRRERKKKRFEYLYSQLLQRQMNCVWAINSL